MAKENAYFSFVIDDTHFNSRKGEEGIEPLHGISGYISRIDDSRISKTAFKIEFKSQLYPGFFQHQAGVSKPLYSQGVDLQNNSSAADSAFKRG